MYIKYNVIFVHVKMMNGDDSGKNQGSITGLSKYYNVFQVPNKNDRLTVDDKLDSPDYRNKGILYLTKVIRICPNHRIPYLNELRNQRLISGYLQTISLKIQFKPVY